MKASRQNICSGFLFLLVTLIGCSGGASSYSPPDAQKHSAIKSSIWVAEYKTAIAARTPACETFQRLSSSSDVPIAKLARVRFIERCVSSSLTTAIAELDGLAEDASYRWLKPLATEVITALALRAGHKQTLSKYALPRSKDLGSQREKEELLQAGIRAAKDLKLNAQVEALETELYRISPRLKPNPPQTEWLKVADDYRTNEDWAPAISYYDKIVASVQFGRFESFKARNGIREVHKAKYRFYNGALATFLSASKEVAQYCEKHVKAGTEVSGDQRRIMFEAWMQYVRDVWSYGDVDVAKRELTRALSQPWLDSAFEAYGYWLQSRIHANYAEWTKASDSGVRATQMMVDDLANSASWTDWHWALWDDTHWVAAFAERKRQRPSASANLLEQALTRTKSSGNEIKFLFWAAQGEFDSGSPAQANTNWQRLATLDPHGFYGFLAHHKLGRPLQPLVPTDLSSVSKPASVEEAKFDLMLWLTYSEELTLAQKFSRVVLAPNSIELDELFLRAFIQDFPTVLNLVFTRIPVSQRNQFMSDHGSLFYPRPYDAPVQEAVSRWPLLDAEYVYAVMRQESSFNPHARSWANAYGLLQILPHVARQYQDKAGVQFTDDYELFRPHVNIPICVAYMDDLKNSVGESFIMRTASYNAKAEKALEWKQRLYNGNIYEFIEEIPYDETRSYIRLVMRNYVMNKRLSASQPFLFPPGLLNL